MKIACFDMEGTLTPEIWEQVALDTGIEGFNKTTRDIPDYGELMDFRLELMASNNPVSYTHLTLPTTSSV